MIVFLSLKQKSKLFGHDDDDDDKNGKQKNRKFKPK